MLVRRGAPEGTRTLTREDWFLRPARMPIPPRTHDKFGLVNRLTKLTVSLVNRATAGIRTQHLFRTGEVLYQMSYSGMCEWCASTPKV